jgi:hypothetical protein
MSTHLPKEAMPVLSEKLLLPMPRVERSAHGSYDVARMPWMGGEWMLHKKYVIFADNEERLSRLLVILHNVSFCWLLKAHMSNEFLLTQLSTNIPDSVRCP